MTSRMWELTADNAPGYLRQRRWLAEGPCRVEALTGGVSNVVLRVEQAGHRLVVHFERAASLEADLVVGADGLHSRVRQLAFGPQAQYEVALGYHVAAFELQGYRPRDEVVYVAHSAPGRQVSRLSMRDDRTLFLFVFRDEHLAGRSLASDAQRKGALAGIFADVGWECPQILAAMDAAAGRVPTRARPRRRW